VTSFVPGRHPRPTRPAPGLRPHTARRSLRRPVRSNRHRNSTGNPPTPSPRGGSAPNATVGRGRCCEKDECPRADRRGVRIRGGLRRALLGRAARPRTDSAGARGDGVREAMVALDFATVADRVVLYSQLPIRRLLLHTGGRLRSTDAARVGRGSRQRRCEVRGRPGQDVESARGTPT